MRTTIDGAGRIVVPKPLREELGIEAGQEIDVVARDGRLEIEVAPTDVALRRGKNGPVAIPKGRLPKLTTRLVRETLERVRR